MASLSDYDFPPKKRVTTYGKAARRRVGASNSSISVNRSASSISVKTNQSEEDIITKAPVTATVTSPSPSPEPRPTVSRTASSSNRGRLPARQKYGRTSQPRLHDESHSQPLPGSVETGEDDVRAKKRKITRTYSEQTDVLAGPYSTPDSSPSGTETPVNASKEQVAKPIPAAMVQHKTVNTPVKDVKMADASSPRSFLTHTATKHQIPLRLSSSKPKPLPLPMQNNPFPPRETEDSVTVAPQRRKRLIDALVAQKEEDSSSDEDDNSSLQESPRGKQSPKFQDPSSPNPSTMTPSKRLARPILATKKSGPKFTYTQQRSMLAERDPLFDGGGLGGTGMDDSFSGGALFNIGRMTKSAALDAFSFEDEEDETVNTGAVRSIHELRQAGANSRFADEIEDILDRVGSPSEKPSSLRRGALFELAQKTNEKSFRSQLRNHGGADDVLKLLDKETDLIGGFAIAAVVANMLATSASTLLLQQLKAQGFAALIERLLGEPRDVVLLAKERKQNVSRNGQTTLGTIKASLLKLPIWETALPELVSPRTLALKCLDLIMRQSTQMSDEFEVFSAEVTDQLFAVLAAGASDQACWDFPKEQASIDFFLALYVLESHSIYAMQSHLSHKWTTQYVPIVADVLETTLTRPADKFNDLESLTLRITLNMTNHNHDASGTLVNKGLLQNLAQSACVAFDVVLNSMKADAFLSKVYESLIMMLGVMINFCVYYPPAGKSLDTRAGTPGPQLEKLIQLYADNHSKTSDADSKEKAQLNVALGYLAILLGYLCLREPIRERFISVHPKKSIQPLVDSLNEFIVYHQRVEEAQGGSGETKEGDESSAMARLQRLVSVLKSESSV
ncbi:wings apart-like protein regulation of heterochromatin-domain-containing protein [Pseudoneurospora amorphoporcata]|uniref:Wings apart-like protein regulation of heterochromatin-domain-containing protein n=1 Tax=Pseudoneurospora amorphoporcata TaxID=241081 RepID=A0AAN6NUE1_9PEZI|nr:wings apart-like protein regulation of heterochromatin-domain-containing protein [Pseudoneurospora amorphoporcata]